MPVFPSTWSRNRRPSSQMTLSCSMSFHFSLPLILSSWNPIPLFLSSFKVLPWITRSMPVFTGIPRHRWSIATLLVMRTTHWILILWASLTRVLPHWRYPCLIYSDHSSLSNQHLLSPLSLPRRALHLAQRLLVSPHFFHSFQTLTQSKTESKSYSQKARCPGISGGRNKFCDPKSIYIPHVMQV